MLRVLFIIPSLGAAGAERQLTELVKGIDKRRFAVTVTTFYDPDTYDGGALWPELAALPEVGLYSLHKRGRATVPQTMWRLLRLAQRVQPHVIHGYMGGNTPAMLVGRILRTPVVWGIRRSSKELARDPLDLFLFLLEAALSRRVDRVIYNSQRGRTLHLRRHYSAHNAVVIPNGFDTARFRPNAAARARQRAEWGIPEATTLVGMVGRLHPVKDHPLFLRAAARLAPMHPELRFVCIGGGVAADRYLARLQQLARDLGLADRVLWVGEQRDMVAAYNALDALVLCSKEEGFPNAVGEAMACGIPCLTTDVGDAAILVGDPARVVPPEDTEALAACLQRILQRDRPSRQQLGACARARIQGEFSLAHLVERTQALLIDVAAKHSCA